MKSYERIKSECIALRAASDQNSWATGDCVVSLIELSESIRQQMDNNPEYKPTQDEQDLTKDERVLIERLADDIGVPKKSLFIRYKISKRVPNSGPLAWIRHSTLTYATMRELYALPNDEDLNKVAKKAVSQNMTVREVRTEMETYRDQKSVDQGIYFCKTCNEPIKDLDNLISVAKSGQNRIVFCGWSCAGIYIETKAREDGIVVNLEETEDVFEGMDVESMAEAF
jgi:hypothetical protein